MENTFDELIAALSSLAVTSEEIHQLNSFIQQQNVESLPTFVPQSFQSLFTLQQWAWNLLGGASLHWINEPSYIDLFHTLASFNKTLIFISDSIDNDRKALLIFPETIDQLNGIFKHIDESDDDDDDQYITIINLWFNNHAYFLYDNLQYHTMSVVDHLGEYFARNCLMNDQFQYYLSQMQQPQISQSIIPAKMLFYIKTCTFYLYAYFAAKSFQFFYTADEMIRYIADDYLQILRTHCYTIDSWNKEFLACMAHLTAFVCRCCWWDGKLTTQKKILYPTEQITCECVQNVMHVIAHVPLYSRIGNERSNDETVLVEACTLLIIDILLAQNINWIIRSNASYQKTLTIVAGISANDIICFATYRIIGLVLTDEQLKELKINEAAAGYCFNMLEQAWCDSSKRYKQIPISKILQGIRNLSKNDSMQQQIADLDKIPLFMDMCDQYPLVYNILWALSFNRDIQQQLRANSTFMSKLSHLTKECANEKMSKVIHGILWNLEIQLQHRVTSQINDAETFDVMISYSHKDKLLCNRIYDELIKAGHHVWIDFDQMHGNMMEAMAQAIDRSRTVIICMSEPYRKSNYCRAEAHYAFQRRCKIVPVLLQKHYKPDGWLLFLTGQLVYVDFIKYEFDRATEMLLSELNVNNLAETNQSLVCSEEHTSTALSTPRASTPQASSSLVLPENILEWSSENVQTWLTHHHLQQMTRLLVGCNGRSLVYLSKHIKRGESQEMLKLLQVDSLRRTGEDLSLIELSCFQSLIDEQKRVTALAVFGSTHSKPSAHSLTDDTSHNNFVIF